MSMIARAPAGEAMRRPSASGPGSGAWLSIIPTSPELRFDPAAFQDRLHFLFGLPLPCLSSAQQPLVCCMCNPVRTGPPILDVFGDHLLACHAAQHFVHDAVVAALAPHLARAGLTRVRSKRAECRIAPGLHGDILAFGWGDNGLQHVVIDVVIASPIPGGPGAAALRAEHEKFTWQ